MKLVATVFVRTVLVLFAFAPAIYAQAFVRTDLALAINETTGFGGDLPWTVTATSNLTRDVTQVASPSGEVFDADRFGRIDETRAFESLEQALEFVAGDWSITRDDSILPGISPPELVTRTFSVESIAPESINRNRPIVTSPSRGAIVGNGQPFLVAWEYAESLFPTPAASGVGYEVEFEDSRQVSLYREFTPPITELADLADTDLFRLQTSTGIASGDDDNRFLFAARVGSRFLPQPIVFTIGSFVDLSSAINQPPPDEPFPGQSFHAASLSYANLADPLVVTLVPEPTAAWMFVAALAGMCCRGR